MHFKSFCFLSSLLLAFSTNAFSQDDSSDDGWVSAESGSQSNSSNTSYDGSADSEFANDEEYASAYARYKTQTTSRNEISKQRSEGFARSVYLGVRAQGGGNTFLGKNSDGWKLGWQAGGGLMIKMALPVKNLSLTPELTFNYRHYTYEKSMDAYTNESFINIMLFELPIIFRYTFEDINMFVGAGINLGLGFNSRSEFKSVANGNAMGNGGTKNTSTIKTSSLEVGGALDVGYMLTRYVHVNLRIVQSFTGLLNKTLTVEPSFENSNLLTLSASAGISYLF